MSKLNEKQPCDPTEPDREAGVDCRPMPGSVCYEPVRLSLDEALMLNIYDHLRDSLEYMADALTDHDNLLGRTTRKNKTYAEMIESDMRKVKCSMKTLNKTFPLTFPLNALAEAKPTK